MNRRGFATIMALVLMALVAAALSAMAIAMHMEQTRTQSAHTQAALRQLLLAGSTDAVARARQWPATIVAADWPVELPPELSAKDVRLSARLEPAGQADASVSITATIEGHSAQQRIQFHRQNDAWTAQSAQLGAKVKDH